MKLTRSELKSIIKECLLELAEEGKLQIEGINSPNLNEIKGSQAGTSGDLGNPRLQQAINMTTRMLAKGDPGKAAMYESIIADTARTTLQKQLAATSSGAGTLVESAVSQEERHYDQAQLGQFEAKDRWSILAFAKRPKSQ